MPDQLDKRLHREIESFRGLWPGGYYEGDPLDAVGWSGYRQLGFVSVLHATYLLCIRPYITGNTISLEIGPGRGAWTKALLPSKEVYVLDALPEEYNGFYDYLGYPRNVKYFQVTDFNCDMLPKDYFDYMFSFGCLCHVSFDGIRQYARSVYPKLKHGSQCFWMVADYHKYNSAVANLSICDSLIRQLGKRHRYYPLGLILRWSKRLLERRTPLDLDEDDRPRPGRFYNAGLKRTCAMLDSLGYRILDPDVGTCLRDPIIHFEKP